MMKKTMWICGLSLLLAGSAFAQYTNVVYSEPSDGVLEFRPEFTGGPVVNEGESGSAVVWVGDWYSSLTSTGLSSVVFPFLLPNAGNVSNPFTSAELQLYINAMQLNPSSVVDLYYIRTAATNTLLATDYYSGSAEANGTRIVSSFITPSNLSSNYVTTTDAPLLAALNAAYAGGAGAGSYVFLRLSYGLDGWAPVGDLCEVSTRNSIQAEWPTLTLTDNIDSDSDSLPDSWEIFYFGEVAIGSGLYVGTSDPDLDGLDSSTELAAGTNPNLMDTDEDGLIDGLEVNTYLTDPLDSDSDDDFLSDGDEVNTYLTDPNDIDSDSDNVNDATEVSCGSDPNNPGDVPANVLPQMIGVDFFDYANNPTNPFIFSLAGGEFFDIDNSTLNDTYVGHTCDISDWYDDNLNSGEVSNQGLVTSGDRLALRSFNGLNTGGQDVGVFSTDPVTGSTSSNLYFKVKMTESGAVSYAGVSFYNGGAEALFIGKTGDGFWGLTDYVPDPDTTFVETFGPASDIEYTIVGKIDIGAESVTMWVDPVIASGEGSATPIGSILLSADSTFNAIRLASGGAGNVRWDDLVVAYTWDGLDFTGTDSDSDSLRDTWELIWTSSLASLASGSDFDADGLNDEVELSLRTDPTKADSDGDGLEDSDEVSIWLTDPAVADTDGDGLSDGFEVTTSGATNIYITNPLNVDTDEDTYNDDVEIAFGSDPTDPEDNPGGIIINGSRDLLYGDPVAVQTVETGFGDNISEWNAAYSYVTNGYLYLLFTGNLENNGNRLEIFIDSNDDITGNVLTTAGNDGTSVMDGMTFDTAFSPEYHFNIWRVGTAFNLELADLVVTNVSSFTNIFGGASEGTNLDIGTGDANSNSIAVAHDNSNVAGIGGTAGLAADTNAAVAVTTGLELCIALSDIGSPTGMVKIALMQNGNSPHGYLANQMLGGLPVGTGNLGGDGAGTFTGTLAGIDLTAFAGDQFFMVTIPEPDGPFNIASIQLINSNTDAVLNMNGLVIGKKYKIYDSVDLASGFTEVADSQFTATSDTAHVEVIPTGPAPDRFFQVVVP